MLRINLPRLPAHVVRWEAFVTFSLCAAARLIAPLLMVIPAVQGVTKDSSVTTNAQGM